MSALCKRILIDLLVVALALTFIRHSASLPWPLSTLHNLLASTSSSSSSSSSSSHEIDDASIDFEASERQRDAVCRAPPRQWPTSAAAYHIALVTDLDTDSASARADGTREWRAVLRRATLRRLFHSGNSGDYVYDVHWDGSEQQTLRTTLAKSGRSLELSELVVFDGNLFAMCDYTGIVYRLSENGDIFPRWALADGNGKQAKPFKAEFATVREGSLYVGSMGKEWVTPEGDILHNNPQWVKKIDGCGRVQNLDWTRRFNALREATNTSFPGYLLHEAVVWNAKRHEWIFVPRRASDEPYEPTEDERKGTNLIMIADDSFQSVRVGRLGAHDSLWGASSAKLIPHSNDLLVLQAYEASGVTKSRVGVFDLRTFSARMPWRALPDDYKYEGIEIIEAIP